MQQIKNEDEQRNFLMGDGLSIIKFGAEWCAPCKALHKVLENLEIKCPKVRIAEVDVDEADETYIFNEKIRNVPVLKYYTNAICREATLGNIGEAKIMELIKNFIDLDGKTI